MGGKYKSEFAKLGQQTKDLPDDSYQKEIYKKYRKYYKKYEAATATKEEREAKAEQIKQIEEVLDIISLSVSKFEIAVHDEVSK